MKKSLVGLLWGESSLKITSILYSSVITAFLLQQGLKNTQIGILWSIVLFSQMIFDYPTGGFADKYGRLKIFTMGMIFTGVAIIVTATNVNIKILYIASALLGIGESQVSGTLFPWFINSIDLENTQEKQKYILKTTGQMQYVNNIIGILTGFSISVFDIDYKSLLIIAGLLHILNGLFVYFVFQDNKSTEIDLMKIGKKSVAIFLGERKLWVYTLAMTACYSFHSIYLFIWQPAANSLEITGSKLGIINSVYLGCLAVSGMIIKHKKDMKSFVYIVCTIFIPIALIFLYRAQNIGLYLAGIILLGLSNGMIIPQIMGTIHYFIPDQVRSSVLSLVSSISSIFLVFLQVGIGKILDVRGHFYLEMLCILCGTVYVTSMILIQKWVKEHVE